MKKNIYKLKNPLGLFILLLFSNFCFSQSDIIISQYVETSSGTTPKGLEIFNISGADIDFSVTNLQIYQGSNGAACTALGGTLINTGVLAADEVWVIGTTDLTAYAVTNGTDLSGNTTFAFGFNGDDALQLYLGGVLQDEFGTCGSDPGSRWTGSGATVETANDNIQIKDAICDGDTDGWTDPSVRFDHVAIGTDMTGFGNAPASCAAASPTILASPSTLTGFTYIEGAGPTAEQSFDVSGSDLTADISVTPPTNWEIATVSGGPYQTTAITLSESGGTVSTTTIYARMVVGLLNVNSPFSGNIVNASTGATSQNVAVDGTVTLSGGCSEIFISEYIEGSASNKFIELYNPTATPILLTGTYDIEIYANGAGTPSTTIALVGTIAAYDVFILENSAESLSVAANQSSGSLGFNGDDAVALTNSSTIIDVIGEIGLDPGTEWTGSTCTQGTANGTIVRNISIDEGDNNGGDTFDPDTEWTCYNVDDVSNLGSHTSTCSGCTHTVDSFTPTSGAVGSTVTITGTGFTGSSTVTFNGTSASVTFVNTTTLTVTVPVGATTGVITVTESGCDVDSATDFTVTACTPTHTISSFTPTSGPELTIVTITGTGFSGSSTVDFNGAGATIISQTTTQLVVEAPTGATTGVITVTESGCPLDSSTDFTILTDNDCTGSTPVGFTDLLFSGIYDETSGSCHYIELFNPTASAIDLSTYSIGSSNNQATPNDLPGTYNGGTFALSGTIQPYDTFLILATSATSNCASCVNVTLDLEMLSSALGYNGYTSADYDKLILLNGATPIDLWSNGDGYNNGYIYSRLSSSTAPVTTFNSADWSSTTTPDCFGFAISATPLPTIDTQPSDNTDCTTTSFTTAATGAHGGTLTYQWRYNDGSASGWTDVTSGSFSPGVVTGETSATINISGTNLDGYQFYCAVFEDDICAIYTAAAQVNLTSTTWDGSSWNNGAPSISDTAIINGNYSTTTNGNISACQLILNSGMSLTVNNSTYVEIENNVTVYGDLVVETQGNFVQNNDTGNFTLDPSGTAIVNKQTAIKQDWFYYTYWSSPVSGETIADAFPDVDGDRRFWFDASKFLDTDGNYIDDNGDDWQYAGGTDTMIPGVGYATTSSRLGIYPSASIASFQGAFNTGDIAVTISENPANAAGSWNFIGNPYPSAIDFEAFHTANSAVIDGAAYFWSQATAHDASNDGNQESNFNRSDYATYTVGSGGIAGASGIAPNQYIPSGQGFFIPGLDSNTATFTNAMRMADGTSNSQFFKSSGKKSKTVNTLENRLWINLTSDNGVFNQLLLAYVNGATDDYDGLSYDAPKLIAQDYTTIFYSLLNSDNKKYAIQGKNINSIDENEVIKLGLVTNIGAETNTAYKISIAQIEGAFLTSNNIYIKDNLLNVLHNLSDSDYVFTSEVGEFNDRFEIVFNSSALSTETIDIANNTLKIVELEDDNVQFTSSTVITNVRILDLLGRQLYQFEGHSNTETYRLTNLNNSVYIAEVELSNGVIIKKKAIKK